MLVKGIRAGILLRSVRVGRPQSLSRTSQYGFRVVDQNTSKVPSSFRTCHPHCLVCRFLHPSMGSAATYSRTVPRQILVLVDVGNASEWEAASHVQRSEQEIWYAFTVMPSCRCTVTNRHTGSLVRVGPNELTTTDPELIRRMSAARSTYIRSDWYKGMRLDPHTENILSEPNVKVHDERRAKMAGAYAGRENPNLEQDVDDQIAAWVSLIRSKYISKGGSLKPLDIATHTQYFTLDVITSLAYGKAFGYLAKDEDLFDYIKIADQLVSSVATIMGVAPIQNFLYWSGLIYKVAPSQNDPNGLGKMMA
jgi:hypothetical protein